MGLTHKYRMKDDPDDIKYNIDFIKKCLKADELLLLNQIHSADALIATDKNITNRPEGDALVTKLQNVAIGIYTADCIPVLFVDQKNSVIAAAHAGWKGAKNGIIENVIDKMISIGAKIDNISVLIGPSIHQKSYEVSADYYENFIAESSNNKQFFIDSVKKEHYMFDLIGYTKYKISLAGIQNIHHINNDTFSNKELYPSYRRSTLNNTKNNGSLLSVIMISG